MAITLSACDEPCDPEPGEVSNQTADALAACEPLPEGVDPIEGLHVGYAVDRFDGLTLTLSERSLPCGHTAGYHRYCGDARGLTLGFPEREGLVGVHELDYTIYAEYETPDSQSYGGGIGPNTQVEIFAINDACITGRIIGAAEAGGPFDGGFQALRCAP